MEELSEVGRLANATELELIHARATRLDEGRRMLPDACEALELARLDGAASLSQGIAARLGRARGRRTRRRRPRGRRAWGRARLLRVLGGGRRADALVVDTALAHGNTEVAILTPGREAGGD